MSVFVSIPSRQRAPRRWAVPLLFVLLWICFLAVAILPDPQQQRLMLDWGALSGGLALAEKKPKPPKPDPKAKNPPAASATPVVTVVGVSVIGPALGKEGDEVRPFSNQQGTEVTLAVTITPPFGILDIEGDVESAEISGGGGALELSA